MQVAFYCCFLIRRPFSEFFVVIVGKVVRYPAWIAFARVESVGEKRDLWRNVMRSAAVGASITELKEW